MLLNLSDYDIKVTVADNERTTVIKAVKFGAEADILTGTVAAHIDIPLETVITKTTQTVYPDKQVATRVELSQAFSTAHVTIVVQGDDTRVFAENVSVRGGRLVTVWGKPVTVRRSQ